LETEKLKAIEKSNNLKKEKTMLLEREKSDKILETKVLTMIIYENVYMKSHR
jgi:hypothetical protein